MDEHGLTPADIPEIGDADDVVVVLAGKQTLTLDQLHALAHRFGVTVETFLATEP